MRNARLSIGSSYTSCFFGTDNEEDVDYLSQIMSLGEFPVNPSSTPRHYAGADSRLDFTSDDEDDSTKNDPDSILRERCKIRSEQCKQCEKNEDQSEDIESHYCTDRQNIVCLDQILCSEPSLLNQKDEEGYTPLHLAVIAGNKSVLKYLIAKGADVNAVDNEMHSAVHWATGRKYVMFLTTQ